MTLKSVVLPAPLGPMRATISPGLTRKLTRSSTAQPPEALADVQAFEEWRRRHPLRPAARGRRGGSPDRRGVPGPAALSHDPAALEHVAAAGEGERRLDVLLDEQEGESGPMERAERLEDALDHAGRESERGLVEHEQRGVRHEGAPDGEHLLLSAGERSRALPPALGQARKEIPHAGQTLAQSGAGAGPIGAQLEILLDAHLREEVAALGNLRDATLHDGVRRERHEIVARSSGSPPIAGDAIH